MLAERDKVGRVGTIIVGGLAVRVRVLDVKFSYGHTRFQITPLEGDGVVWVENVAIQEEEQP